MLFYFFHSFVFWKHTFPVTCSREPQLWRESAHLQVTVVDTVRQLSSTAPPHQGLQPTVFNHVCYSFTSSLREKPHLKLLCCENAEARYSPLTCRSASHREMGGRGLQLLHQSLKTWVWRLTRGKLPLLLQLPGAVGNCSHLYSAGFSASSWLPTVFLQHLPTCVSSSESVPYTGTLPGQKVPCRQRTWTKLSAATQGNSSLLGSAKEGKHTEMLNALQFLPLAGKCFWLTTQEGFQHCSASFKNTETMQIPPSPFFPRWVNSVTRDLPNTLSQTG